MAKQTINQGTAPTGAGGDTFRSGSVKLQANDNELYNWIGNGSSVTTLPAALPVAKGGTGATTAGVARANLGLGSAAIATLTTSNTDSTAGRVLKVADFGLGAEMAKTLSVNTANPSGFYYAPMEPQGGKFILDIKYTDKLAAFRLSAVPYGNRYFLHASKNDPEKNPLALTNPVEIKHTGNTTVDGNGFIKNASPIVQLFSDKIEMNEEAQQQPITFEKLGVGDYLIKGSTGFAQEGWYVETPKDANGNLLVAVVYEQLENGDISVKTYDYMLNNKGRIVADTETPLDIPEARWIDLRLQELPQPEIEVTDDPEQ